MTYSYSVTATQNFVTERNHKYCFSGSCGLRIGAGLCWMGFRLHGGTGWGQSLSCIQRVAGLP